MLKTVAAVAFFAVPVVALSACSAQRTGRHLTRHHAVGLDRLAVTFRIAG